MKWITLKTKHLIEKYEKEIDKIMKKKGQNKQKYIIIWLGWSLLLRETNSIFRMGIIFKSTVGEQIQALKHFDQAAKRSWSLH